MCGLKKIRLEKGLTQEEFSELLGISKHTLQSYEIGRRDIKGASYIDVVKWADILKVNPALIVGI